MDASEEVVGSNDYSHVIKGKRTKRQRPSSPLVVPMSTTSSSTEEGGSRGDGYGNSGGGGGSSGDDHISPSPTISAEFSESTEEEEDMANCLILLAQGHNRDDWKRTEEKSTMGKSEFYVYECKTCNRCFPSFQALGGHRASHKKPKSITDQKKALILFEDDIQFPSLNLEMGNRNLYSNNNNKSKIHECSICGSEFSSGQALGGHMRRHKTPTANSESQDQIKKQRNVLSLDLNLPAPEDDQEPKFSFVSKQRSLVFSASALVDCHY